MTDGAWWATEPRSLLSQGDVFGGVPGAILVNPLTYLNARPAKNNQTVYEPSSAPFSKKKGDDRDFMLSNGEVAGALIVSYDCEIDKSKRTLIAPIFGIETLPPENRIAVMEQRRFSLMPLPDVPQMGTSYADFRLMQVIRREYLHLNGRVASMNDDAVARLQAQLVAFFTRKMLGPPLQHQG